MKKIVLLIVILLLTGCTFNKSDKFYLNNKYYNKGEYIKVDSKELESIKDESMIIYTYNNFCNLPIHCENVFKEFMDKYKIDFISIPFMEFKKTSFYSSVSYAPSVIIIHKGKIVDYLKADSDSDYSKYQDVNEFDKWISNYINLAKATSII